MVDQNRIWDFVEAMSLVSQERTTKMQATVSSIDKDGTVWVLMPGSDGEAPCAASSAEAARGDTVTVEWRANRLYVTGNLSNQAAGANRVAAIESAAQAAWDQVYRAKAAADSAIESAAQARIAASNATTAAGIAQGDIDALQQWFWHDEKGSHILSDDSGYRNDTTSTGMAIVEIENEEKVASFGLSGAVLGQPDEPHTTVTQAGIFVSEAGATVWDSLTDTWADYSAYSWFELRYMFPAVGDLQSVLTPYSLIFTEGNEVLATEDGTGTTFFDAFGNVKAHYGANGMRAPVTWNNLKGLV